MFSVSAIRKVAMENIKIIYQKTSKDKKNGWNFLLSCVTNIENEIELDAKQFKRYYELNSVYFTRMHVLHYELLKRL